MQDWPPCELNTVHAALLNALEEVEGLMQPVGGTTPHMQLAGESMQGNILPSPSTTGGNPPAGEWWLQERHHGLGNAPGTDLRSPTEAMDSGSEESHRRRRMHAVFHNTGEAGECSHTFGKAANRAIVVQGLKTTARLKPLSEGFKTILGGSSLLRTIVDAVQLEKIVCGRAENVDVDAIRSSAELEGWTDEDRSEYLPWLWEVLASVSPAEKAQFLVFCTASDRVPLKGWQSLGLIVQKNGVGDERLPSAYTCFSQLLLPRFSTKEKLRSGLLLAIANSEGFGLP
ncbi:Ubiquitin-protein ligase E3A [Symbiodinium microadriaticum]|uniref:HECT-type E3 ubiquitin transferase n=1 Tax=Symbiodinium microadriaticum TaxID=2951 RepID=A0A1Q9ESW0_SYMMI|nr:Ubiquitin-protein ligase E3A [Symbiodinium microadriaticum]